MMHVRFTPVTEVKLCGHATLAVAHALYESGRVSVTDQNQLNNIDKSNVVQDSTINFHTASGILTAKKLSDGSIELCFPITPVTEIKSPDVQLIDLIQKSFNLSALDEILFIGESEFDLFIEVKPDSFTLIEPVDMSLLRSLDRRGIILTCIGNPVATVTPHNSDFTSRCFFPR